MARVTLPESDDDEVMRVWSVNEAMGMAAATFSTQVYANSRLPESEREVARMRIARINDCTICQSTRTASTVDDELAELKYADVEQWRTSPHYSERERLAIETAERFALDHLSMDDEFFDQLKAAFTEDEIMDLLVSISAFLVNGRLLRVLDVAEGCRIVL
jgi:alkylhydroperoxidase family enzyme